ncbi:unnamed protein product [Eruca vesicaria subsp. sativa]|uniref:Senescence regulator n=1 Tax=Eruca vesicaria subsp. sativa TaxID=29727 RepID=A0ABC8L133_ERUVS|nr:unnamed protein product [Eruca vesicaria subsp. sativa]
MAEEFDEAEVVFSEDLSYVHQRDDKNHLFGFKERNKTRRNIKSQEKAVVLPENMFGKYVGKEVEEEYNDGRGEIVPPHVMVGRRIQGEGGQMAFSVCSGSGRTLKGRDLSRVRNSVLRLTGFLEA